MKKIQLILLTALLPCFVVYGQTARDDIRLNDAVEIIEKLTSEEFSGRGYTENGMWKASEFIAEEFEKIGLEKIDDSYFQEFSMPINIIKNSELTIDGIELKYGIDFLVKPNSKSQEFHQKELYFIEPEEFSKALESENNLVQFAVEDIYKQSGKHVILPPYYFEVDSVNRYYKNWPVFYKPEENRNRSIFYFTKDKLTASLSLEQDSISEFIVSDKFYNEKMKIDHYKFETDFVENFKARNVIGKIEGINSDKFIVITAHYDHLGKVGQTIFPGASDNASGVALLLELAKHFKTNPPKYSLVFIAFAAEEAGMIGSFHFVENPLIDLSKIKFLLNFDIAGAGEDGIQIVNSSIFENEYNLLNEINSEKNLLSQIKKRGEACNSDHCPFYLAGVSSFFTYTLGGPGHYHDPNDTAETLNLSAFLNLNELFIEFIQRL